MRANGAVCDLGRGGQFGSAARGHERSLTRLHQHGRPAQVCSAPPFMLPALRLHEAKLPTMVS
eukprot:1886279-Rhodomonas_salina.1